MTLAEMSLKRPVTAIMLFVSMTVIGLIAAFRLPLEAEPDVQFPFMAVDIPYPGSTPGEIERTITRPVEEALSTLTGVQRMRSVTRADGADIFIQFKWGHDIAVKAVEARAKIDAIRKDLPSDLQRYFVQKFSSSDRPVLGLRVSSNRDMSNSYELLDRKVKRPLEHLPGVARVEIQGVSPNEVQIEISSDRLTAAGVGLNDLYQRLSNANFSAAGGLIRDDTLRYRVQPVGEWHNIGEVRDLAINDKGLKLSDIADVTLKPKRLDYARHLDHRPAIAIDIFKERSANLVEVGRSVNKEMERISQDPEMSGIQLYFIQNQAEGVTDSLSQLTKAGIEGTLLSIIVLFFFLRDWPSTLMVSLAIPICFIITLGCMQMLGMTLNILSMMGLLLAVGMLVDNAVVVVESIYQYREKYPDKPWYCAVQGTQVVGIAIAAGTLSSIIVFLPMVLGEKSGVTIYLTQVAVAMAIAHLASWLVAVSLVPMLSAKLPPPKFIGKLGLIHSMQDAYARTIAATLRHRRWTVFGLLGLLLVSFIPAFNTKFDMFPSNDSKQLHLEYQLNALYTLPELKKSIETVEAYFEEHRKEFKIKNIYSFYNEQGNAMTNILFDEKQERDPNLTETIRKGLPKVPIGEVTLGFNGGNGNSDPSIQLSLNGDSSTVLRDLSATVIPILQSVPGLRDVRSTEDSGNRELAVRVDREKAKSYGFSASDVAQFVAIALRGMQLKDFHGGDTPIPVWLRFQGSDAQSLDSLSDYKLRRPDGTQIPLMSMVDVQTRNAASVVERDSRQTSFGIKANLAPGATLDEVRKGVDAVMKNVQMPPGYRWSYGENFDRDDEAGNTMMINTLVALVLVYVVMCAMFESLIYPAAILTTFAFSVFGVFWTFWLTGTTFSIMASIGVLILMGVIVNNGIVMIVHINQLRHDGMDRREALIQGARDRLRPILMTMGTAILGMVPLCFGRTGIGGDGPPYYPMARAIAGGLFFSTVVSLIVLPTIYSLLDDMSQWAKRVLRDARERRWPRLRAA
ncbi:MAG: efflux RND transporter permease subunit [Rudaea sp.]|uniref:efflux RND transporter permease subunit n=2 Tax=unclassified Rudaea TaxID=2627037 RepID=UPI0010F98C75|nr:MULTISPECIES: efflux RND transporter permease subunit [unclassified Rudaea]MBN8884892.1 efflux RND transporter permease subunit [Rudaea sp.]